MGKFCSFCCQPDAMCILGNACWHRERLALLRLALSLKQHLKWKV